jgi:hypothetical protein
VSVCWIVCVLYPDRVNVYGPVQCICGMWNVVGAVGILSVAITHVGPSIPTRAPTPGLGLSHKLPCDHPARHRNSDGHSVVHLR